MAIGKCMCGRIEVWGALDYASDGSPLLLACLSCGAAVAPETRRESNVGRNENGEGIGAASIDSASAGEAGQKDGCARTQQGAAVGASLHALEAEGDGRDRGTIREQ